MKSHRSAAEKPLAALRARYLNRIGAVASAAAIYWVGQVAAAQVANAGLEPPVQTMLIKNALTAVNHGNLTGNYTVLRDLGSERFRQQNDAAKLAAAFAGQRAQHFDLSPILLLEPIVTGRSFDEISGRVKLTGSFSTVPRAVQFACIYQRTEGGWSIDEITIGMLPPAAVVPTTVPIAPRSAAQQSTPLPLAQRPTPYLPGQPQVR